jgi:CobQ-like glutamine amidotransferase family enzyme
MGTIYDNDSPFIVLDKGTGNKPKDNNEGYTYNNLYATYTIGPLFIRNPYLTKYFVKKIIHEKNSEYKLKIYNSTTEIKAYNKYLENFNIN